MSRNLASTACYFCKQPSVFTIEAPRPVTVADVFVYFNNYEGMLVAHAECAICGAEYLAWVDERPRVRPDVLPGGPFYRDCSPSETFYDLSFRSTFNDEEGPEDGPKRDLVEVKTELDDVCFGFGAAPRLVMFFGKTKWKVKRAKKRRKKKRLLARHLDDH